MPVPSMDLVARLLKGDLRAAGRLMSRAEAGSEEARAALGKVYKAAGKAHIVGLTGVPGSGKSTLVSKLVQTIREDGRKVGVIAIDPSSPFSGGSILGDRIRMSNLTMDDGVYIRSMATRGSTGGLARSALAAVDILDAAGFDVIIIETVGVGQDEVEIARASHSTIVVSAPGLGDDVQAIKAGILEIADIHVVSKCDRADANRTITDLKTMLAMGISVSMRNRDDKPLWQVPVVGTSAETGEGIGELVATMDRHRKAHHTTELGAERLRRIAEYRTFKTAEDLLRSRFFASTSERVAALVERISRRELDPFAASDELMSNVAL
ncbi:MAG: LAO/AO ABC transporter ATP-binding protein [Betaproteobacteria bacterium SG8_40]|nr:MAG: LAO/AO ABC transporter ATP-binding protein [Betaproteobacteria bacterium SG8_40]